jgi:hypothetical protein
LTKIRKNLQYILIYSTQNISIQLVQVQDFAQIRVLQQIPKHIIAVRMKTAIIGVALNVGIQYLENLPAMHAQTVSGNAL